MNTDFHSVTLQEQKCIGCTDCIKRCPTEAIRVRNKKAIIIADRCIDCGNCISVCKQKAKLAVTDSIDMVSNYKYTVAIPAPTLYSQFKDIKDINIILTALRKLGFNDVFEVAIGAELVTKQTQLFLKNNPNIQKPIISSACPVIIRLIQIKFPSLIKNILPILSPMEVSARLIKEKLHKHGMSLEDIGVFFISPCSAKATHVRNPIDIEQSYVNGVISIREIYMPLLSAIKTIDKAEILRQSTSQGVKWASTGGEGSALGIDNSIAVDGIENVIKVLEEVENGRLEDVDFIEGLACIGGCLGGPLTVENEFVAKNKLEKLIKNSKDKKVIYDSENLDFGWTKILKAKPVLLLDKDMGEAIRMMEEIENINEKLPHIDCGSCGAPNCHAFAEDIVRGKANLEDCIFMLKEKIKKMECENSHKRR